MSETETIQISREDAQSILEIVEMASLDSSESRETRDDIAALGSRLEAALQA